jgi:hypothetical protein
LERITMTKWYSGHGWGWCSVAANISATVLLWGTVVTAMVLAARFLAKQRRTDPRALRDTGSIRIEYVVSDGSAHRREMDNDQWHRRLM